MQQPCRHILKEFPKGKSLGRWCADAFFRSSEQEKGLFLEEGKLRHNRVNFVRCYQQDH